MKVVLAEKPSVARDIARYLRATAREDGYLEGNGYQVTWAFGHLVSLAEPAHYDAAFKKWSLDPLPIVPEPFQLALTGNKDARKQFNIIKRLLCAASEIIAATDAGREGELIFRYILQMTGCSKTPVRRLWLSSLTHDAISSAFASLRPLSDYDNLFAAARCRAEADWIVGINATRYFTLKYPMKDTLWSVGRVQTPLLAMIVARDDAIRDFNPKSFWELHTTYRKTLFRFTGPRFTAKKDAQEKLHLVLGHHLVIHKVDTTTERANPPKLFDLTELQREMNRLHNLSASDTLSAAQSLYEKKLITYPRTDSRYLTKDIEATIPGILRALSSLRPTEIAKLDLAKLSFSKRITDDKKVADHHAIIPTGTIPDQLTEIDQSLFDAISTRLIAAFYPPCSSQVTTVDATANQVPFRAKGVRVTVTNA